jgi:hypothetical protein
VYLRGRMTVDRSVTAVQDGSSGFVGAALSRAAI